jgi:uncharacterized surface protein with fasciclin (FAS1) repeats
MKKFQKMAMIALLAISTIACDSDDDAAPAPQTITDIAAANPNFSTLVTALQRTGLDDVLDAPGSYTVFAPTNAAFTTFLSGANVNDVPVPVLTQILLNHVVSGTVQSSQLTTGYIETLATFNGVANGSNLNMYVNTADGVELNGVSTVTTANIIASNGVIHVVDAVIGLPTVVTFATADPNFSSLVATLTSPGQPDFVSVLSGAGPFTVFAPTNAAFTALGTELAAIPLVPSEAQITEVLEYHVVSGNVLSSSLTNNQVVTTIQGGTFTIGLTGGAKITDANARVSNIIAVDVQAANGVIHVVDKVLLPTL